MFSVVVVCVRVCVLVCLCACVLHMHISLTLVSRGNTLSHANAHMLTLSLSHLAQGSKQSF